MSCKLEGNDNEGKEAQHLRRLVLSRDPPSFLDRRSRTLELTTDQTHQRKQGQIPPFGSSSHPAYASYSLVFALPYTAGRTTLHPGLHPPMIGLGVRGLARRGYCGLWRLLMWAASQVIGMEKERTFSLIEGLRYLSSH